jgi:uncharacterized membrane protein
LPFDVIIFLVALWALSSEMIEDSFVNLILGHMYGWRTLIKALTTASIILITLSVVLVYYALTLFLQYIDLIEQLSAGLLGVIGVFWLVSSILRRNKESEAVEEARKVQQKPKRGGMFLIALQLELIEVLEVLLIIIPLVITSHVLEASSAGVVGIIVSITTAASLRKRFEKFVVGRLGQLKIISGLFLIALAFVLFLRV